MPSPSSLGVPKIVQSKGKPGGEGATPKGLSNARQISGYADDELARIALEHRKANNLGRKGNVAVVEYELDGETKTEAFDTVGKAGKHAEYVAKDNWTAPSSPLLAALTCDSVES